MDMQEFSARVEAVRTRLYRTAYLYLCLLYTSIAVLGGMCELGAYAARLHEEVGAAAAGAAAALYLCLLYTSRCV